ncbi:MAG: MoaD/ThiS family protein [Actinomycetota bacterium]|nr:MoaD/ThiS family protein [Actinomycetota bacterium]MDD5667705.1 MoaD/ThiS family protein [Actinomycetota bacterium]
MATVKFFTMLRKVTGEREYESSAPTVGAVIREVEKKYGGDIKRYTRNCIVLVNGQNINYLKGKRTKLAPGDEVSLFPPVAGG